MGTRGGTLSIFLNAKEYDKLEKTAEETGLTKSRIMKMSFFHFMNSNAIKALRKAHIRQLEIEKIGRGESLTQFKTLLK